MSVLKYNKNQALKAQRSASIKSAKIAAGVVMTVVEIISNESADTNLNRDELLCVKPDGKKVRVPIREFMNMTVADNGTLYKDSEEDGEIVLPSKFTVKGSKDRVTNRRGEEEVIFPLQAYNAGAAQIAAAQRGQANAFDFDALLESGVKEGNTMDAVQDYTIATEF